MCELHADDKNLRAVTVEVASRTQERRRADRLFLCIGGEPRAEWAEAGGVHTDRAGYVLAAPRPARARAAPGVLAALPGPACPRDERAGRVRRRGRPARLDQARGRSGRGRRDGRAPRPASPRRDRCVRLRTQPEEDGVYDRPHAHCGQSFDVCGADFRVGDRIGAGCRTGSRRGRWARRPPRRGR